MEKYVVCCKDSNRKLAWLGIMTCVIKEVWDSAGSTRIKGGHLYMVSLALVCLYMIMPPSHRDIFPLMKDHEVFADCITLLVEHVRRTAPNVDVIVGLDARGFIFGPMMAQQLGVAFAPIRKAGKLPGETVKANFALEYGSVS